MCTGLECDVGESELPCLTILFAEITLMPGSAFAITDTPSVTEQEVQRTEMEAAEEPQKNYHTLNQQIRVITLRRYSSPSNCIELLELKKKIAKILLYEIYWRVGDSLTDEVFRSDYKNELKLTLQQINQITAVLA